MKILVNSLAGIGDTLIATPFLHELRANFPDATIYVFTLWPGSQSANGADVQSHRRSGPAMSAAGQPHLFKLIKLSHFGAEDVDDDIAGINQHPVAGFFAFHLGHHTKLLL